jgi:molybdenum cofactor biosynthesis enzyme
MFPFPVKKSFSKLTHTGPSKMVNVGSKNSSLRYARAGCNIKVSDEVIRLIKENANTKGDVLRTAEIAGIMGGKQTSSLVKKYDNSDSIMSSA